MENFNLKIINLKKNIVNLISEAELPAGVIYYILKDLFDDITNVYQQSIVLEQTLLESKNDSNKNIDKDSNKFEEKENN